MHACMHACMYVCMYVCTYVHIRVYIYIYIYMPISIWYTRVHTHTHTHIYIYIYVIYTPTHKPIEWTQLAGRQNSTTMAPIKLAKLVVTFLRFMHCRSCCSGGGDSGPLKNVPNLPCLASLPVLQDVSCNRASTLFDGT